MHKESVVLVHGLWFNGLDMSLLRLRLNRAGYNARQFSYPSVRSSPLMNAMALNAFMRRLNSDTVHLVGHSLGGIIIRHLLQEYPDQRPGRVVTLGTPHHSSSAARTLSHWLPGRIVLGKSVHDGLLGGAPRWPAQRELGCIAGTLRLGMGTIVPGIPRPSDGTVAVEETQLSEMRDHIALPVSHFGMLLSSRVAKEVVHFLRHGRFSDHAAREFKAKSGK
ncbi:MAG: alpha/beta fold hydrolase [Gammaproteobacteria bacterium]|nr:alpha/beta fold hydrolase [Gammaproteobacteria bacterium]